MVERINIYLKALAEGFLFYLKPIMNLNFSFWNPLFWVFILLLFLPLLQSWHLKKSFQFSLLLAFIFLGTTKIELFFSKLFSGPGQTFDTGIIKLVSACILVIVVLFYSFILK